MTWNERKFVNDVLAQNVKDVLAQNVNDVMLDNLTTHTYDETFAQAVVERIRRYAPLLQLWLGKIGGAR